MVQAGIAIVIFILCSSYKSYPTVSKLTALKILTIILTALTGFMILSFLCGVLPAYIGASTTSHSYADGFVLSIYGALGVYQCIMTALCVIACILGYRTIKNGFLENAAYQEQRRKTNMFFGQYAQDFRNRVNQNYQTNQQQGFTTEYTSWQCKNCEKYNNAAHNFCIYCGRPKQ